MLNEKISALQAQKEEEERIQDCKSNSSDDTSGRVSRTSVIRENKAVDRPSETHEDNVKNCENLDKNLANRNEQNEPLDLSRKRQNSTPRNNYYMIEIYRHIF